MTAKIRSEMQYIAAIQDSAGKVVEVLPVIKTNKNNIECDHLFGKVTIWNTGKIVVRGAYGRFTSLNL